MDFKDFIDIVGKILFKGTTYLAKETMDSQRRFLNSEEFKNMTPEEQEVLRNKFESYQEEYKSCEENYNSRMIEQQAFRDMGKQIKELRLEIKEKSGQPKLSEEDQEEIRNLKQHLEELENDFQEWKDRIDEEREA